MFSSEPYSLSGRTGLAFLLPLIGIASASVAALAYEAVHFYVPIAGYISFLFVVGMAAVAGAPVMYAAVPLNVRNPGAMRFYGAVTGVVAVYFDWLFFAWLLALTSDIDRTSTPSLVDWIRSPAALWQLAGLMAEDGSFTVGGVTPKGVVLWLLWLVEAGIVIGTCVWLAPRKLRDRAFCENCERWMANEGTLLLSAEERASPGTVRKHGLARIQEVKLPSADAVRCLCIRRQRCPQCKEAAVYCVHQVMLFSVVNLLSPFLGERLKRDAAVVIPLTWQRDAERRELERIAGSLIRAPVAGKPGPLRGID